jgi:hypothetical protein
MNWKTIFAVAAASSATVWGQTPGMHPRPNMHDYADQAKAPGGTVAASVLSPAEVRGMFTIDLASKGYTVVEVAFFPDQGSVRISPDDFTLRLAGEKSAELRPVGPEIIAHALGKKSPSQNPSIKPPVDVVTSSTIGYENYPTVDQNGRQRQSGGWVMGSGVGVGAGVGGGRSAPDRIPDNDRESLEAELANRSLQEGEVTQAVAGFLYFRSPNKKKDATFELQYAPSSASDSKPVKLTIQAKK